jgi:hypothetical protein
MKLAYDRHGTTVEPGDPQTGANRSRQSLNLTTGTVSTENRPKVHHLRARLGHEIVGHKPTNGMLAAIAGSFANTHHTTDLSTYRRYRFRVLGDNWRAPTHLRQ